MFNLCECCEFNGKCTEYIPDGEESCDHFMDTLTGNQDNNMIDKISILESDN